MSVATEPEVGTPTRRSVGPDDRRSIPIGDRGPTAVAILATVVGAALCLYDLGAKSLWYDEGYTVGLVDRPFGDALWRMAHWEVNQSAYFLAFAGWFRLGQGEAFLRLLSAGFAVATIPAMYALGRRLFDPRVGAAAAVLVATNAFLLQWGQQLRAYSLVVLLVTVASYLLVRAVEERTTAWVVAYAAVAVLAVYAHFFAALVIAGHGLSLLVLRPVPRRLITVGGAVIAVGVTPIVAFFVTRQGDPLDWVGGPSERTVVSTFGDLAGDGLTQLLGYSAVGVVAAAVVVGVVLRQHRSLDTWRHIMPVLWLTAPVMVAVGSTYTVKPLLVSRFLIVVVPALCLLVALGLCRIRQPAIAVGAAIGLVVVSAVGLVAWYDAPSYEDWRSAAGSVAADAREGDTLVLVPPRAQHVAAYYLQRSDAPHVEPITPGPSDPPAGERLWVFDRVTQGGTGGSDTISGFVPWRDRFYELVDERPFGGVVVRLYQRRAG